MFYRMNTKRQEAFLDKEILDYNLINSISKDELVKKSNIEDCSRKVTIFHHSSNLFKNSDELIEDLIMVENKVVHTNTPLAYDSLFQVVDLSFMSSIFIFAKPTQKQYDNQSEIYYLYGFSSGYGTISPVLNKPNEWIDYGFTLYDKVNNFNPKYNETCKFVTNNEYDRACEFLGPIFPNVFTEDQFEILTRKKYNTFFNVIDSKYYLKDLLDNDTKVETTRFQPLYRNDFEPGIDFFTLQAFEMVCFLFLFYKIQNVNIIYHSKRGFNCKDLYRDMNFLQSKNSKETIMFLNEIKKELDKFIVFYKNITKIQSDYCIMVSSTPYSYGIEIIEERTSKTAIIKISKPEMLERIFTKFSFNNAVVTNYVKAYNKNLLEDTMKYIGEIEELENIEKDLIDEAFIYDQDLLSYLE